MRDSTAMSRAGVVLAGLVLGLAACTSDDSSGSDTATDPTAESSPTTAGAGGSGSPTPRVTDDLSVDEADVEDEIERVPARGSSSIEDVDCPGDLPGRVGAALECTATIDGKATTLRVVVTSAEDDSTEFDVEIVD